jgi:4-hydroxy-4-methyl-2-oxoglutarate aldolase
MEPQLSAMDAEIKSVVGKVKIVGPALTVRGYPGDELTLARAITIAKQGDVIVVDARGVKQAALMGGIGFGYCWQKGVEGVVIDGATRDIEELTDYGFPVFARAVVPASAVSASMGQINMPIQCGGVNVNPGDIIVGDTDGVVVVPRQNAEKILAIAERISSLDDESIGWIRAKVPIDEIKKRRTEKAKEIRELKEKLLGTRLETHW